MKKKSLSIILAVILFLFALGLTLYPLISNYVNEKYASELHTTYIENLQEVDTTEIMKVKHKAVAYNQALVPGITTTDAYAQDAIFEASKDYENQLNITKDGTMGYIEISKIGVRLPIYHGTNSDSLERGVGHLLGSSLPVGGENTHSVLTAHSGMSTQKMFSDLPQMEIGDIFYVRVLGETLAYQVDQINTVLPYDTSYLGIQTGEDLCTLVTCTPFGINTHRLLVRGTRIPYEEAEVIVEEIIVEEPTSTWEQEYLKGIMIGLIAALLLGILILIIWLIRRCLRARR